MTKPRILLVEDDDASAQVLAMILEMADYNVTFCAFAKVCLQSIATNRYDLVILDLMLPDMTTEQFVSELEKIKGLPPILIHSARPVGDLNSVAKRLGLAGFLQKPAPMQTLLETVASVISTPVAN
jgi:two-component system, OmpR family, phosphate regulon response regulator PhoB